jgi:hypothetical protein
MVIFMMFKDIHGLRHWKEEPDPVVELGRICYKAAQHTYICLSVYVIG